MGGCKTYGGRKTYQRTRFPENSWTPPKELLVCSVVDFCTGKTERWRLRGVENVPYEGGSKTPFWEGCPSWLVRFSTPSFFHPPWRPLKNSMSPAKNSVSMLRHTHIVSSEELTEFSPWSSGVHAEWSYSAKGGVSAFRSPFVTTPPFKNPSYKVPSQNPSKKRT